MFKGVSAAEMQKPNSTHRRAPCRGDNAAVRRDTAVFKGSIEEIHRPANPHETPGHPAHTLKAENKALEHLINDRIRPHLDAFIGQDGAGEAAAAASLAEDLADLGKLDIHYTKKEHLFFPYMEQHGITAPPKVMWAVDDEIRNLIKEASRMVLAWAKPSESDRPSKQAIKEHLDTTLTKAIDMISKEDDILLPMVMDVFTDEEWKVIAEESKEIGYFLISPPPEWKPATARTSDGQPEISAPSGSIVLPTGALQINELVRMLDTLPVDITFVDKDNTVDTSPKAPSGFSRARKPLSGGVSSTATRRPASMWWKGSSRASGQGARTTKISGSRWAGNTCTSGTLPSGTLTALSSAPWK